MALTRAEVAGMIDHTLLAPGATAADVAALCREAGGLGVFAVCVSPSMLPLAPGVLPAGVALACVAGFPSGAHRPEVKAFEAERAIALGADEVDVVIDLGAARAGRWEAVVDELVAVRAAVARPARLKVIIESALLDEDGIVAACRAAEAADADFVKTSTGFHPAGGAGIEAVALMRATVGDRLGVKASGGIRTPEAAAAVIEAGASRIGASASAAILAGFA